MYKSNSIWDKEQERQDDYTAGSDEGGPDYKAQADYSSGGASDVYDSGKAGDEDKEKKNEEATGLEKDVADQGKKYEKKEDVSDEDIKKTAASEVHGGNISDSNDGKKKKKEHKSIEDAINKAMKEEKEIIYVDD